MWAVLFYYYGNFKGNPVLTNCPSFKKKKKKSEFPGGPVVKNPRANAADVGSVPHLGRFHRPSS